MVNRCAHDANSNAGFEAFVECIYQKEAQTRQFFNVSWYLALIERPASGELAVFLCQQTADRDRQTDDNRRTQPITLPFVGKKYKNYITMQCVIATDYKQITTEADFFNLDPQVQAHDHFPLKISVLASGISDDMTWAKHIQFALNKARHHLRYIFRTFSVHLCKLLLHRMCCGGA